MKVEVDRAEFDIRRALLSQWAERTKAIKRQFLLRVAQLAHDRIVERIPSEYQSLQESLQLARVVGLPDDSYGYVIRCVPKRASIGKEDADTTILYVVRKRNLMFQPKKGVDILADHSPWTLDTLPFEPDPKVCTVVSRRVSGKIVGRVRKLRRRDSAVWRLKMTKEGLREVRKGTRLQVGYRMHALPDVAFDSIRLEFGLGGLPSHPHWRPTILKLASRSGLGMIFRKREFARALGDVRFRGWRTWPRKVGPKAPMREVRKKYYPFQKKLGVRVKR